jgi:hypothetical protein
MMEWVRNSVWVHKLGLVRKMESVPARSLVLALNNLEMDRKKVLLVHNSVSVHRKVADRNLVPVHNLELVLARKWVRDHYSEELALPGLSIVHLQLIQIEVLPLSTA